MALSAQVRKGERTRAALIRAAIDRFAAEGFHRVSLTDIARDVGVSPTAVYRYFPDKEALFEAAVNADAEALARDAGFHAISISQIVSEAHLLTATKPQARNPGSSSPATPAGASWAGELADEHLGRTVSDRSQRPRVLGPCRQDPDAS